VIHLNTNRQSDIFQCCLYVAQELCQQYLHSFGKTITYTTSDPELSDANVSRTSHLSVSAMLQLGVAGKKKMMRRWGGL